MMKQRQEYRRCSTDAWRKAVLSLLGFLSAGDLDNFPLHKSRSHMGYGHQTPLIEIRGFSNQQQSFHKHLTNNTQKVYFFRSTRRAVDIARKNRIDVARIDREIILVTSSHIHIKCIASYLKLILGSNNPKQRTCDHCK